MQDEEEKEKDHVDMDPLGNGPLSHRKMAKSNGKQES